MGSTIFEIWQHIDFFHLTDVVADDSTTRVCKQFCLSVRWRKEARWKFDNVSYILYIGRALLCGKWVRERWRMVLKSYDLCKPDNGAAQDKMLWRMCDLSGCRLIQAPPKYSLTGVRQGEREWPLKVNGSGTFLCHIIRQWQEEVFI